MKELKFSDYKDKIIEALSNKGSALNIDEPISLIKGFFKPFIYQEFYSKYHLTELLCTVPMVALVGNKSGRVYFFALKVILPDIEI